MTQLKIRALVLVAGAFIATFGTLSYVSATQALPTPTPTAVPTATATATPEAPSPTATATRVAPVPTAPSTATAAPTATPTPTEIPSPEGAGLSSFHNGCTKESIDVTTIPAVTVERTAREDGTSRVDLVVGRPAMQVDGADLALVGADSATTSVELRDGDETVRTRMTFDVTSGGHTLQLTYELDVAATGTPVAVLSAVAGHCG